MITQKLKDEAERTIAGITDYYTRFGDQIADADEMEGRISKVTEALEGCNGLTEKEKIQKTAENLFGLTCTWERDSLALKRELILSREMTEKAFEKSKKETAEEFSKLGSNMVTMDGKIDILSSEIDKLGKSLQNAPAVAIPQLPLKNPTVPSWHSRIISLLDDHFGTAVFFAVVVLILLIFSGNLDQITAFFNAKP